MKEDFNRVVVLDFSKFSKEDLEKYFAAFRTQEDAVKAIKLTQAAIKYLSE